jgi:hypothetical protein
MKINTGLVYRLQSGGITVSQGVGYEAPKKRMLTPDMMEDVGVKSPEIDLKPLDDIKSDGYHTAAFEQHVGSKVRALKTYVSGMDKWDKLFEGPQIAREIASITNPTTFLDMKHQEERTKQGHALMKENKSETLPAVVGDETWVKDVNTGEVKKVDMGEYMSRKATDLKQLNWNEFNMYWDAVGSRDLRATDNVNMGWNYGGEKLASKIKEFATSAGGNSLKAVTEEMVSDPKMKDAWFKVNRGMLDPNGLAIYKDDFKKIDSTIQGLLALDPTLYNSLMAQSANKVNPMDDKGKPKSIEQLRKDQYAIMKEDLLNAAYGFSTTDKESTNSIGYESGLNERMYGKKGSGTDDETISFWNVATNSTPDISQLLGSYASTIGSGAIPIRKIEVPVKAQGVMDDMVALAKPIEYGSGDDKITIQNKTLKEMAIPSGGEVLLANGMLLDQQFIEKDGGKYLMSAPGYTVTHLPRDPKQVADYIKELKSVQDKAKADAQAIITAKKSKGEKLDAKESEILNYAASKATDELEAKWEGGLRLYGSFNMVAMADELRDSLKSAYVWGEKKDGEAKDLLEDRYGRDDVLTADGNSLSISQNRDYKMTKQLQKITNRFQMNKNYTYTVPVYIPMDNAYYNDANAHKEYQRTLDANNAKNSTRLNYLNGFYKSASNWGPND